MSLIGKLASIITKIASKEKAISDLINLANLSSGISRFEYIEATKTQKRSLSSLKGWRTRYEKEDKLYRCIILTFDTDEGTNPLTGLSWAKTHVEVTGEICDNEKDILSFAQIEKKVIESISKNEAWSWILALDMKVGYEEEKSMEEWKEIHVIIRRTTDYKRLGEWTIPY